MVVLASAALLLLLIYLAIIEPHLNEKGRLQRGISIQQESLAWMQATAPLFKGQKNQGGRGDTGQSLMTTIDQSARKYGLNSAIKKIQPEGQRVRIQLSQVSFDNLLIWLSQLENPLGYRVEGVVVEAQDKSGEVDARVIIGDER
jgi:type II secretory pathway component PulM